MSESEASKGSGDGGGGTQVEAENIIFLKRKLVILDKLLKNKEKLNAQNSTLSSENMFKDNKINSIQAELEELRANLEEKSAKLKNVEKEKRDLANASRQMEATVAKLNSDIFNAKVVSNGLISRIEDLEAENETLQEKLKTDIRKLKTQYEEDKWQQISEISKLKQQNTSLQQKVDEKRESLQNFDNITFDNKKLKKENAELKLKLEETRQDKQVEMLMRKLAKAEAQIKKLATKNLNEIEDCYIPPDSPVHPSSTGGTDHEMSEHEVVTDITKDETIAPKQTIRFPIFFPLRRKNIVNKNAAAKPCRIFKAGSISYSDPPLVLGIKPVISFSNSSKEYLQNDGENEQDQPLKLLYDEQIKFLEDILDSVTPGGRKRKRTYKGRPPISPYSKKYKKDTNIMKQSKGTKKGMYSAIKVISPDSINNSYNIATSMEVDETSDEDHDNDEIIIDDHLNQDSSSRVLSYSGKKGEVNSSSLVPVISSVSSLSRVASVQSTPRLPSFTPSASLSKVTSVESTSSSQLSSSSPNKGNPLYTASSSMFSEKPMSSSTPHRTLKGNTLKPGGEPSTPNLLHSSVTSPYKCQSSIININQIKPSKNSKDNRMIDKNQQESNVSRERTNEINKRSEKSISSLPTLVPVTVSDEPKSVYYDPNPGKTRKAHTQQTTSSSICFVPAKNTPPPYKQNVPEKLSTSLPSRQPPKKPGGVAIPPPQTYESKSTLVINKNKKVIKKVATSIEAKLEKSRVATGVSTTLSGARAKVLSQGFIIETPMSVTEKQTEEQKAEKKKHMVGRAAPGVATRPSVDGFRASEPLSKSSRANTLTTNKITNVRPKAKVAISEDMAVPERRKTQPARMTVNRARSQATTPTDMPDPNLNEPMKATSPVPPTIEKPTIDNSEMNITINRVEAEKLKLNVTSLSDESEDESSDDELDPDELLLMKQKFAAKDPKPADRDHQQQTTEPEKSSRPSSKKSVKSVESESSTSSDDEEIDIEELMAKKAALAADAAAKGSPSKEISSMFDMGPSSEDQKRHLGTTESKEVDDSDDKAGVSGIDDAPDGRASQHSSLDEDLDLSESDGD